MMFSIYTYFWVVSGFEILFDMAVFIIFLCASLSFATLSIPPIKQEETLI